MGIFKVYIGAWGPIRLFIALIEKAELAKFHAVSNTLQGPAPLPPILYSSETIIGLGKSDSFPPHLDIREVNR